MNFAVRVEDGEMMSRDPLSYPSMLVGSGDMAAGRESKHVVLGRRTLCWTGS